MLFCESCGSLKRASRGSAGVAHACPRCDGAPTPARSEPMRATKRFGAGHSGGPSRAVTFQPVGQQRTGPAPDGGGRFFPFDTMRPGQAQFVADVRSALTEGKVLLAQVPTGLGKTAGVLAPALEAAARSGAPVFFLTPKQSQHRVVVETLKLAEAASGTRIVVSDMIAKKAMCPRSESETLGAKAFSEFCSKAMAKGTCSFYETDEKPVVQVLGEQIHHVEDAVRTCEDHHVCPFKALTEVARVAHVVVMDYNHFFSDLLPSTLDRMRTSLEKVILVVDEAHNLPDRIRDHLSSALHPRLLDEASSEVRQRGASTLARFLDQLAERVQVFETETEQREIEPDELLELVADVAKRAFPLNPPDLHALLDELQEIADKVRKEESYSACGDVVDFFDAWPPSAKVPERAVLRMWSPEDGAIVHRVLDAAHLARPIFRDLGAAVLMSGTLFPMEMYSAILGVPRERAVHTLYPNPFPRENRRVTIDTSASTAMDERGPATYERIADRIKAVADATDGNVAAFFPSYHLLESVQAEMGRIDRVLAMEERGLDKAQREALVDRVRAAKGRALLMGVLGGSLSEGYDFVEDGENLLRSVLVVGIPYAVPTLEVRSLQAFYDEAFGRGRGWAYGYLAPALQRVLQAAGRGVRAEHHRAFVGLIDRRYTQPSVKRGLPPDLRPTVEPDLSAACARFFGA